MGSQLKKHSMSLTQKEANKHPSAYPSTRIKRGAWQTLILTLPLRMTCTTSFTCIRETRVRAQAQVHPARWIHQGRIYLRGTLTPPPHMGTRATGSAPCQGATKGGYPKARICLELTAFRALCSSAEERGLGAVLTSRPFRVSSASFFLLTSFPGDTALFTCGD